MLAISQQRIERSINLLNTTNSSFSSILSQEIKPQEIKTFTDNLEYKEINTFL
jgi:hypothetical protein